jgi:hypothetical protein
MSVAWARPHNVGVSKIQGILLFLAIVQFVQLCHSVQTTPQLAMEPNNFRCTNGMYSAKTVYNAFLMGSIQMDYADLLRNSCASLKEKLFMWLALRNRCWTLSRKGLFRASKCLLCDHQEQTIDNLMVQCPTFRSIWF